MSKQEKERETGRGSFHSSGGASRGGDTAQGNVSQQTRKRDGVERGVGGGREEGGGEWG